jgi:hypothetical protein
LESVSSKEWKIQRAMIKAKNFWSDEINKQENPGNPGNLVQQKVLIYIYKKPKEYKN